MTRIRERRLERIGLGTRCSCASARVCLKKEREIQELKKDAKKLLTTAGLVRDCPSWKKLTRCSTFSFGTTCGETSRVLTTGLVFARVIRILRMLLIRAYSCLHSAGLEGQFSIVLAAPLGSLGYFWRGSSKYHGQSLTRPAVVKSFLHIS